MYMTGEGKAIKAGYQWEAKIQWKPIVTGDISVSITLYFGAKRRADIDNFNKGMHKPWPKCADCKNAMSLTRRTSRLDDIVEATESSFICEHCSRKKKPGPYFPLKP